MFKCWGRARRRFGIRNIVEVIFAFSNNCNIDFSEKFLVRVDEIEEFPFLVTKLSPYYDR